MVNYDTPRQYLNFKQTDFLIFILVCRHMTFKLKVDYFFAYSEESTGCLIPYGLTNFSLIPFHFRSADYNIAAYHTNVWNDLL